MSRCILIDLDGTLADMKHRVSYVSGMTPNWEKFFSKIELDPVNEWCSRLCRLYFSCGFLIHLVTGRPNRYRIPTEKWLIKHEIPYSSLFMRNDGDHRSDDIVKLELFTEHLKNESIDFVIDDREPVVQMWRKAGLLCLQCNPT